MDEIRISPTVVYYVHTKLFRRKLRQHQSPRQPLVAPTTKAAQPKKSLSKSKAAKESYAKSPNAKFGPRKKTDYIKPTTPVYPIVQTTAAANDPTLVKLVTLSHPESLAYPLDTNATSGGNSNMTLQQGGATPPAENTGFAGLNTNVITRGQKPVNRRLRTTTVRPTPDPDLLADINEARVMQGLPEVQAHQVDLQGNLLPFYQRQMRIGRLPARPHPLHNPGGIHHQLQHQHEVPHYHPEQGLGAGFNSFQQLFYPQHTNNGAVMNYEPFPRPNIPVPTTAAPNSHAADPVRNTGIVAPLQMVDAGPLNPLAHFYFISALNNLLQPQNNGRYQQLYQNRNGQNFNGLYNQNLPNNVMHGLNAFSQLAHSHASSQNMASQHTHASGGGNSAKANGQVHGELGGIPNSLDLHHQAIHMEAGNAMTPHLHRQVHRLLRNRELSRQRGNMFGMQPNFPPAVTQTPFIDPDLYADMMEAQAAAMAG
ncbi:uncharacterized protein LOC132755369 [Ruditapes philippinarum]|uniref:uncharacterized protein LOC132755369 n=1 Tax=Ruditapes philippinarum TaxID=129788 RepID=UPI00295BD9CA|nr:uncharacterized protein LOC132755369 [Ruditapes philippinarum]